MLNATTDFHPIAISPVDAQLDCLEASIAARCGPRVRGARLHARRSRRLQHLRQRRVTDDRIQNASRSTRGNVASNPPSTPNYPAEPVLKIRTDGLLRADTSTRYAAYKTAIEAGFMTVDEVRALENRAPLEVPRTGTGGGVMNLAMEIRSVDLEERTLVGVVAPYDEVSYLVPDPGGERIMRGAFAKSIRQRSDKIPLHDNHGTDRRLGISTVIHR